MYVRPLCPLSQLCYIYGIEKEDSSDIEFSCVWHSAGGDILESLREAPALTVHSSIESRANRRVGSDKRP